MKICNNCIKRSVCKYTELYSAIVVEQGDKPVKVTLTCDERLDHPEPKQGGAFA